MPNSSPFQFGLAYTQRNAVRMTQLNDLSDTLSDNTSWSVHTGVGTSHHHWAQFNLGDHVGDKPEHVNRNREQLQALIGHPLEIVRQVHGTQVCVIHQPGDAQARQEGADALVTRTPGIALVMLVADCLPVLFVSAQHGVVAAAHAGWRGLAAGVLNTTVKTMADQAQCSVHALCQDLQVWLGPCIGPSAFEVGPEVLQAFVHQQGQHAVDLASQSVNDPLALERGACAWLNLPLLARLQLQNMGVADACIAGNDGSPIWCTFQNESHYFSHRRSFVRGEGPCGRMAACVWIKAPVES